MTGYIYCHKNKVNNKIYIGQTKQTPDKRWGANGLNYSSQNYFYRDIIRYGWDNFEHSILETVEALTSKMLSKKLNELEIKYIKQFESMNFDKGYNSVFKDTGLHIRLTVQAKRSINNLIAQGKTFEEAYEIYHNKKK